MQRWSRTVRPERDYLCTSRPNPRRVAPYHVSSVGAVPAFSTIEQGLGGADFGDADLCGCDEECRCSEDEYGDQ